MGLRRAKSLLPIGVISSYTVSRFFAVHRDVFAVLDNHNFGLEIRAYLKQHRFTLEETRCRSRYT